MKKALPTKIFKKHQTLLRLIIRWEKRLSSEKPLTKTNEEKDR